MREETWFSAEEAQATGLCDEITSSARNEFMNLNPLQLVAAVDAEYQTNNHEKMEKINLSAEAIVALGSKSGQMDEAAVSEAIVATVAAKDKEIADLKTAKEKADAASRKNGKIPLRPKRQVSPTSSSRRVRSPPMPRMPSSRPTRPIRRTPAKSSAAYRPAPNFPVWSELRAAMRANMLRCRGTNWTGPGCSPKSKPTTPTCTKRSTRKCPLRCTSAGDNAE